MEKKRKNQVVLFDKEKEIFPNKVITDSVKTLTLEEGVKLKSYALENYIKDIENEGLEKTWNMKDCYIKCRKEDSVGSVPKRTIAAYELFTAFPEPTGRSLAFFQIADTIYNVM